MQNINLRAVNGLPVTHTAVYEGVRLFNQIGANHERQIDKWAETTEAQYYECLGAVPPAVQGGRTFAMGEPWRSNSQGEELFATFTFTGSRDKKRFFARYMTAREAKEFIQNAQ